MLAFAIRRLMQAVGVIVVVAMISFALFRFVGDPINQLVGQDTTPEQRAELRQQLGLDDSVPVQFARYFGNAAQFKFGVSYQFRQPVSNLLMERMPATLELAFCATVFAMAMISSGCSGPPLSNRVTSPHAPSCIERATRSVIFLISSGEAGRES